MTDIRNTASPSFKYAYYQAHDSKTEVC